MKCNDYKTEKLHNIEQIVSLTLIYLKVFLLLNIQCKKHLPDNIQSNYHLIIVFTLGGIFNHLINNN